MIMEECFPLMKDGNVNPDLMSFSKLYLDEIVQTVRDRYSDTLIQKFLQVLGASDVEMTTEYVEWLVTTLLRSKEGFKELYSFLAKNNRNLLDQMMIKGEGGVYNNVVEAFKEFFLREADDPTNHRLEEMAHDIDLEFDEDDEKNEEQIENEEVKDEEYERMPLNDSDDTLPDDYASNEIQKVVKEKKEEDIVEEQFASGYKDTVLDKIAAIFDPEFAHGSLIRSYGSLCGVKDPLSTPSHASQMKYSPWARAILRQLPRLAPEKQELPKFPSLVFNFAKACENDPFNRVALSYLLPDYSGMLDARDAATRALYNKGGKKLDMVTEVIKECRPAEQYAKQRRKQIHEYQTTVMPITLREYQKELVQKANKGENTVIVAPTGSGKTVVAAQIMRHHVMSRKAEKKPYRMIMVVPKIPLVEQQHKQLNEYMSDVVYSAILHGDMMFEEQGKMEKVLCAELIVMTAQILINLLQSVRNDERLFVSDLTLLILDECHHCDSNHPYAQLMTIIREWKYDKPQVVGLTASLGVGVGGAAAEGLAYNHVIKLLARMTATSITPIVIHEKELQMHVQLPVDDIKSVETKNVKEGSFTKHLRNFMNAISKEIRGDLQKMTHAANESGALIPISLLKNPVDYSETEKYRGRIEAIKQSIGSMRDGSKKRDLIVALEILKVCNTTWGMNDLLPSTVAWPMMKSEMFSLRSRNGDNRFIRLFYEGDRPYHESLEESKEDDHSSPMLNELRNELKSQMEKNPLSKVIVFVATRELAKHLAEYVSDWKDLLKLGPGRECDFIISSKARGIGSVSQSPAEQKRALTKFRNDKLAVLVSTTVAEEGLDVPECNLIIKYNMTGNVISLTQQRGRARAKDSRSVLIVLSGSVKKREYENAAAERMMNHIVRKIHREGDAKLRREVEKEAREMKEEEDKARREAMQAEDKLKSNSFEILCADCNLPLCDSYQIKNDSSHFFACDRRIWEIIHVDYIDAKGKYIDTATTVVGKVLCKGDEGRCRQDLGKIVRFSGCYFPSLKATSIQLRDKKDASASLKKVKKWNDVVSDNYFFISKINDGDVGEMMNALSECNVELFSLMESKCRELLSKSRREALKKYDMRKEDNELRGAESD